jgi:hypothetical protein
VHIVLQILMTHGILTSVRSSRYPLAVVNRLLLKTRGDLIVVFANMLCIPSIATAFVVFIQTKWERGRSTFKLHVSGTHDSLPDVFETVVYVPRLLNRIGSHDRVVNYERHGVVSVEYRV